MGRSHKDEKERNTIPSLGDGLFQRAQRALRGRKSKIDDALDAADNPKGKK